MTIFDVPITETPMPPGMSRAGEHLNRDELKRRRIALGMTQADAAKRAGLGTPGRWANIESGKRSNVTLGTLFAIAKALDCNPADLLILPDDA